jgi:hypothetical protein
MPFVLLCFLLLVLFSIVYVVLFVGHRKKHYPPGIASYDA